MMRFSCADYTFPLLARSRRFQLLNLLGFKHVDIGLFERSSDLKPAELLAAPRRFTGSLLRDLKSAGLETADVFMQTGPEPAASAANDPRPEVRSRNRKLFSLALDLCASLGAKHLTGLPGVFHPGEHKSADLALAVDEAGWRQRAAAEAGIVYAVEAHLGSICPDIASTRALLVAVPGLTLTLDYGHFVAAGVPSRDIHSLLRFASHIHVRGGAPSRLQTPVSENQIDFAGIARRLSKQGYTGYFAVEYVYTDWQQCNLTDNISETLLLRRFLEDQLTPRTNHRQPGKRVRHV